MFKTALCIPTYNSEKKLQVLLPAIKKQTLTPDIFLVIDSSSKDNTVSIAKQFGAEVLIISQKEFNHGSTRNLFTQLSKSDIYLYLTDDAIPASDKCFEEIISVFKDEQIGIAYGRQLPHQNASLFAAHARLFNYPNKSIKKTFQDSKKLGIKTCFCSNSFAAYRAKALEEIGGFPSNTILSEDTYAAGQMLLNGWAVQYCAEATVLHSHNYTIGEEFKRYFDIGVFYGREKWIKENFGSTGGEGKKFLISEFNNISIKYCPEWFFRNGMKLLGYKLGTLEKYIPARLKKKLSMHKNYWKISKPLF